MAVRRGRGGRGRRRRRGGGSGGEERERWSDGGGHDGRGRINDKLLDTRWVARRDGDGNVLATDDLGSHVDVGISYPVIRHASRVSCFMVMVFLDLESHVAFRNPRNDWELSHEFAKDYLRWAAFIF